MHGNEKISLIDVGGNVEHNRKGRAAKGLINENGSNRRGEMASAVAAMWHRS